MTNIQSKSVIPFCKFIDNSVIHVSIFYMLACVNCLSTFFISMGTSYLYNNKCVEQLQCKSIDLYYVNTSYNTHDNNNTN